MPYSGFLNGPGGGLPYYPQSALTQTNPFGGLPSDHGSLNAFPSAFVNNPWTQLGAGLLLGGAPGGTLGGGLNLGIQNVMNLQRQQQATAMLGMQIQAMQAKRMQEELKRQQDDEIARKYGVLPGITPTSAMINAGGLPGDYQQNLIEQTRKTPLIEQHIGETQPITALTPEQQAIINSGEPYMTGKGTVAVAPDLPPAQRTAAGFAARMVNSGDLLDKIDFDPTASLAGRQGILPKELQSDTYQQVKQAQDDWIRAKLRKESGAVIAESEMEGERQTYFPQPGEGPQTVLQKRTARIEATNAMIQEASKAYQGEKPTVQIYRTQTAPEGGKKGDIWITPEGQFYVFE